MNAKEREEIDNGIILACMYDLSRSSFTLQILFAPWRFLSFLFSFLPLHVFNRYQPRKHTRLKTGKNILLSEEEEDGNREIKSNWHHGRKWFEKTSRIYFRLLRIRNHFIFIRYRLQKPKTYCLLSLLHFFLLRFFNCTILIIK